MTEAAMMGLFEAEHRPSHEDKWRELEAEDAPLARHAVVKAEAIRADGEDPGNAYLRGVADALAWLNRQRLIAETGAAIEALPETTEPNG